MEGGGGQRRMRGRESGEGRELKMGRGKDRKENVSWLPYQSICSMKMNVNAIWMSSYTISEDILSSLTRKDGVALKWRLYHLTLSSNTCLNFSFFPSLSSGDLFKCLFDQQMYVCICIPFFFPPPCSICGTARRPSHRGRGK